MVMAGVSVIAVGAPPASKPGASAKTARATSGDFVRFVEDGMGARLETAIARCRDAKGTVVDLVGAVHIADKAYYDTLNQRFKTYDAVLYELVGPPMAERLKSKQPIERGAALSLIGRLQAMMRDSLELEGQLESVDYAAPNFVHADMSVESMQEAQQEKGESFLGLWLAAVQAQLKQKQGDAEAAAKQPGLAKILEILCRQDGATALKRMIGREFDQVEGLVAGVESDGGGTVLIGERNRVALEELARQIAVGKKQIAIFYGAAHLDDMAQRLESQGFQIQSKEWLTAWDLPPEPAEKPQAKARP